VLVAIDGPAGAGKSTVARAVAAALGIPYLDTGAMYRCVALAWPRPASELEISFGPAGEVLLDGRDVSAHIRTAEIGERASEVAARPEVRAALIARQRELIGSGDHVAEGRDIATVVAPEAEVKIFLTASPQERARRRAAELGADPAEVERALAARDAGDSGHGRSTEAAAPGAITVDTTGRTIEDVVAEIVALAGAHAR
jgi:cytidylate kinase